MKTAYTWMAKLDPEFGVQGGRSYTAMLTEKDIKQIQLDAIKEGMRRAANICRKDGVECDEQGDTEECCASYRNEEAILSASEQLTEEDL